METKICSKCDKNLSLDQYYVIKKSGYLYGYCKKCHYEKMTKATAAKWRIENKDRWVIDVRKAQKAMWKRDKQGVYLLITSKGLYVGQTDKYQARVNQHRNSNFKGNMKAKGAKVLYATLLVEEKNALKRRELEKKWIRKLRPNLNKEFNPDWEREKKRGGKYIKK